MTSTNKLKLFLIASLIIITPLLSSSLRTTYLYLFANILILVVGAEAGLLSIFSNNKPPSSSLRPHFIISEFISPDDRIEKCSSDKGVGEEKKAAVMKKSPSLPSIFFIEQPEDRGAGEDVGEESGQELFHKAETFIGNFYKQLKMQREESWKKLDAF